jgi:3-dehydroshikimate dehydratase
MKTSFCSIALRDEQIKFVIPKVAAIGYDGIEIWGQHLEDYMQTRGSIQSLKGILEEHKLAVSSISPIFNFTGTADDRHQGIVLGKRYIDFAEALDRPIIRTLTGSKGSAEAAPEDWQHAVDSLRELCEAAQPRGICMALEIHPKTLTDTIPSTVKLLNDVNYPNLRVVYDAWHVFCEGKADPVASIDTLFPYIIHVHARNKTIKKRVAFGADVRCMEEGDLDYKPVLEKLKQKNYLGHVSVEWFGLDRTIVWEIAERELKFLKQFTG